MRITDPDDPYVRLMNAPTPLAGLHAITTMRRLLDQMEAQRVAQLRSVRTPWAEMARALGVSRQGLVKRYRGTP